MQFPSASILHRDGVRRLVDERTFERGRRYHEEGRVASLQRRGSSLHGRVRGESGTYEASIWARGAALAFACTCPAAAERSPCKHGVALALSWLDEPEGRAVVTTADERNAMTPYVVHIDQVAEVEGTYPAPFDAEKLSIYKDLGRAAGSKNIGFAVERLLPGRRTSFTHAHSDEEELVYVLSGTCNVRVVEEGSAPREIPLRAGHAVSFPPGTGIAHTFVNRGTAECVIFVVGERRDSDRVFYAEDRDYDAHHAKNRPERHWTR